jgi:hypothetical protein
MISENWRCYETMRVMSTALPPGILLRVDITAKVL